jgi:Flp pilus assembly pilin Flp
MKTIVKFLRDERGLELPEYAVNAAIVIGITAAVLTALASAISGKYSQLTTMISGSGS